MRVIHEVVRRGIVEKVAIDVLSAPPLLVDELIHDLGVQDFEHLELFQVPKAVIAINVKPLHQGDHFFRFLVDF